MRNIAGTVFVEIALPISVYLILVVGGLPPVWALLSAAGVSVAVLSIGWLRTRKLTTLGAVVLAQFILGVIIALVTGDARFVLAKDYLVILVIALAAAVTIRLERPFIARIRRDLAPDPDRFEDQWHHNRAFRAAHRRLTWWWVIGLVSHALVAVVIIYAAPLTVAVITTNILTPLVLITLITITEAHTRRAVRLAASAC